MAEEEVRLCPPDSWRRATLVLNASRRFRYSESLPTMKEEEASESLPTMKEEEASEFLQSIEEGSQQLREATLTLDVTGCLGYSESLATVKEEEASESLRTMKEEAGFHRHPSQERRRRSILATRRSRFRCVQSLPTMKEEEASESLGTMKEEEACFHWLQGSRKAILTLDAARRFQYSGSMKEEEASESLLTVKEEEAGVHRHPSLERRRRATLTLNVRLRTMKEEEALRKATLRKAALRKAIRRFRYSESLPTMKEEEAGFDFVYRLPSVGPLQRWRRQVWVIIAVLRLQHTRPKISRKDFKVAESAARAARLFVPRRSNVRAARLFRPRRNVRFRSIGFAILFMVSLSSQMKQKHVKCTPLYRALNLISTATNRKVSLDSYLLNACKCEALVLVLSLVSPHLSIFRSILTEHMSSTALSLSSAAISGCYYALEDMCRVIARCVAYINDRQGLNPAAILDGASTVKCLISEINSCLQLFLIKVGELPVFPDCGSDLVTWPMNYLEQYLQLQADSDLCKLLSRLKELSTPPSISQQLSGGEDYVSNLLSQLTETPKSWKGFWGFRKRKKQVVSDFCRLLIARIEYDMERFPTKKEDIAAFKQGLWVEKNNIKTVRFIGSGSFGTVHEVECFKQKYAMKTIPIKRIEDASEALIQARLQHPHIVKLIWYTTGYGDKESISLLMELMHMGLDAYLLKRKKCPLSKCPLLALHFMSQIAEAGKYLHNKGIMHRDLKSSNVMLDRDRGCEGYLTKLVDFGFAKQGAMTNTANVGTDVWRAPEVLSASADEETARYSYPADVFSYGMVCYEILTSKEPYTDTPRENLKWRIQNLQLRPSLPEEDMHPDLVLLIKQCWDADPKLRPSFHAICQRIEHVKHQLLFGNPTR